MVIKSSHLFPPYLSVTGYILLKHCAQQDILYKYKIVLLNIPLPKKLSCSMTSLLQSTALTVYFYLKLGWVQMHLLFSLKHPVELCRLVSFDSFNSFEYLASVPSSNLGWGLSVLSFPWSKGMHLL